MKNSTENKREKERKRMHQEDVKETKWRRGKTGTAKVRGEK